MFPSPLSPPSFSLHLTTSPFQTQLLTIQSNHISSIPSQKFSSISTSTSHSRLSTSPCPCMLARLPPVVSPRRAHGTSTPCLASFLFLFYSSPQPRSYILVPILVSSTVHLSIRCCPHLPVFILLPLRSLLKRSSLRSDHVVGLSSVLVSRKPNLPSSNDPRLPPSSIHKFTFEHYALLHGCLL